MASIKTNSLFGFLGFLVPSVITLLSYPIIIGHIGISKFGIFTLATSFSGTLAFLDFGFSAATLKFMAEYDSKGKKDDASSILTTSIYFYGTLGILVSILVWCFSPLIVSFFSIIPKDKHEAIWVFRVAGVQFFFFFLTTVMISLFKGLQRFDYSTMVLSLLSILTFGGGAIGVAIFKVGLLGITLISCASNLIILITSTIYGNKLCKNNNIKFFKGLPDKKSFEHMFKYGSIMTINSASGIFLYQIQRYVIGAYISTSAVTIYQLAMTICSKAHAVVDSATAILFPVAASVSQKINQFRKTYVKMLLSSGFVSFVILLPLYLFTNIILKTWIGEQLANQVAPLVRVLVFAFFFLSLSPAPYHVINGVGKLWLNTFSYALNAILNVVFIILFAFSKLDLLCIALAFTLANIINSIIYQLLSEIIIWRNPILLKIKAKFIYGS
ncbi:MAG: oligosaccharide flippase family protein [Bacteroidota bacterium]